MGFQVRSRMPQIPGIVGIGATEKLVDAYRSVRRQTFALCEPLSPEDFVVQSMPDASPVKWHLAHTTWFFETFLLGPHLRGYEPFRAEYSYLFNSYYNAVGERIPRAQRGLLSRPPIDEVFRYRAYVDERMLDWLSEGVGSGPGLVSTIVLGLNHEQQHQELILTDLKHAFAANPLRPVYRATEDEERTSTTEMSWRSFPADVRWIGFEGDGFSFDNESPRHRQFVDAFQLGSRPVTNGEFLEFLDDGGYSRPELWLSDGWEARRVQGWTAPMYWEKLDGTWSAMTLAGMQPVIEEEPVCHVSFYEADAYARWAGARLPTEAEWETAALECPIQGNFLESGRYHPSVSPAGDGPSSLFGDVWEWTASPYIAYPAYRPAAGALGEYNGKFMCNQMVLRGGSCATPQSHIRATYRNFFPPQARWQFMGFRLARDV
jgi:ergothioneine biosynthesis protein EgtB